mmetsp:Transcript_8871/g.29175  ORF Transcript_8871/g.29175 Transcript_8871/m.29175 type:complete len:241 (+) Transcript_8871:3813-4535(+)
MCLRRVNGAVRSAEEGRSAEGELIASRGGYVENLCAADKGGEDAPAQRPPFKRRHCVPVLELVRGRDDVHRLRVPNNEIGILARRDRTLILQSRHRSRGCAPPVGELDERSPALARLRPRRGKRELQRSNPAPCLEKISRVEMLRCRGRGRVVGAHEVNDARLERTPQPLAVLRFADGRRTLEPRVSVRNLFRGEREVVRARLNSDRGPGRLGLSDVRETVGVREMRDVSTNAGAIRNLR